MASDPFDFNAPLKAIDGNFATQAGRKYDAWFAAPHAELLASGTVKKSTTKACKQTAGNAASYSKAGVSCKETHTATVHGSDTKSCQKHNGTAAKSTVTRRLGSTFLAVDSKAANGSNSKHATSGTKRRRPLASTSTAPRSGSTLKRCAALGTSASAKPAAGSRSRVSTASTSAAPAGVTSMPAGDALAAKLAAHNSKFRSSSYEPRAHGVRDVRRWEACSGKAYAKLTYAERAAANKEIAAMKAATAAT
jgi:hypothetical protein